MKWYLKLIILLLFIPLVSFGQVINEEVKTYYESGQLETIVDGLKQGEEKWYYKSVKLMYLESYIDDLIQGEVKSYFESGDLMLTINYVNSKLQGEQKNYYKSGELESTVTYVDGVEQ